MTAPRWTFTGDRAGWSLSYGSVVIASSTSQRHTVSDALARLVADLDAALDDLADANAAADALTAWAATIKGRGSAA